jgi:arylsulfatase A-like enzyme
VFGALAGCSQDGSGDAGAAADPAAASSRPSSPDSGEGASPGASQAPSPSSASGGGGAPTGSPPNLIVFLVDTLRADALGFSGYQRDVSPRLDAWSRRGAVFEQATTPSGWTKPAVLSLFTGLYPSTHGVQDKHHVAPPELMTLAEVLKSRGYRTAAYITNFAVSEQFGTGQGFSSFRFFDKELDSPPSVPDELNYVPIGTISDEIEGFLSEPGAEPFFVYVHTTDPHYPYLPPAEYRQFGSDSRGRYDGEVRFTDAYIGRWLDLLEQTGRLRDSVVVLTADHGEEFREHGGTGHGVTVFAECVRVPLVFWGRGVRPGRNPQQVSLADLPRTLLHAAGLDVPAGFGRQSRSFWPIVATGQAAARWSTAYSDLVYPTKGITFGYREGDYRYVHIEWDRWGREDVSLLFNSVKDPLEQRNLAGQRPELMRSLRAKMEAERHRQRARAFEPLGPDLDPEAKRRLKALGYID